MLSFEGYIQQELKILIEDIIVSSEAAGQRASGKTYDNIAEDVQRSGEFIQGSVYAPNYFYTLIKGRGPGKVPTNMVELIMEWAGYKGITFSTPEEMLRFANAVKWKIKREGNELYRNHLYIDIIDTPIKKFEERLSKYIDQMMDAAITSVMLPDNNPKHGFII